MRCNISVSNGQRANAQTFNDAFLSRTTNSDTVAIVGLNHPASGGLITNAQQKINDNTAEIVSNDTDIATLFLDKEDKALKGVAGGYASLDGSAKVPLNQIPDKFASIEGNWDADTNTPTLTDGVGNQGQIYVVNVAGTTDFGSGPISFELGDWVIYREASGTWEKTINSTAVTSVNGETGAVVLSLDDIDDVDLTTTAPLDGQALVYDDSTGDWRPGDVATGASGSGGINYVLNPDAERNTDNWTEYDDGNSAEPVDGTGSPSSSLFSLNLSSLATDLVRGTSSFNIIKGGANAQGYGQNIGLRTIDPADTNKRLQVSFEYKMPNPGGNNYVDGDYRVFVYDVDNGVLLGAVSNDENGDVLRSESIGKFIGFFNSTNSLNYRLLLHVTTTSTDSSAISMDNVQLGPVGFLPVQTITDWEDFNPTWQNLGGWTFVKLAARKRRVNDTLEIQLFVAVDGTGSGTSKIYLDNPEPGTSGIGTAANGKYTIFDWENNNAHYNGNVAYENAPNGLAFFNVTSSGSLNADRLTDSTNLHINIWLPIVEWQSSNNVVSNTELTQKTIKAEMHLSSDQLVSTDAPVQITFNNSLYDSHSGVDLINNRYVVQKSEYYNINLAVYGININQDERVVVNVLINGNSGLRDVFRAQIVDFSTAIGKTLFLNKGDAVTVTIDSASDTSYTLRGNTNATDTFLTIESLPDFTNYGVLNPNAEYLEAIQTSTAETTTADTEIDIPGLTLDLTPGTWVIGYNLGANVSDNSGATNIVFGRTQITDSLNVSVPNTSCFFGSTKMSANQSLYAPSSIQTEITITENKTYKSRLTCNESSAQGVARTFNDNITNLISGEDITSKMWARRIK